ncbi:MAG: PEP-CTERM/exosortase system-associated acyltransferase [Azoarcus sp.]|jgi:N-acyl amino acid synthase of PEP-CTERM/exosortase system|nr:PEP-CTERM/exosortase system-associated acyltransferase [Azoarcus sp.]
MRLSERFHLGQGFRKHFTITAATGGTSLDDVLHIRHEVYCEEMKYEPVQANQLETDEYDAHSLHCLIRSADARQLVGSTRLILTDPLNPATPLPFESICAKTLDRNIIDPQKLARGRIAEVSRQAIRSAFRRRSSDAKLPLAVNVEDFGTHRNPRFPYVQLGLYLGAVALAKHSGIDILFVLTEPRLSAHFAKLGVNIRRIGSPVEHRGIRVPSMIDVQDVIDHMSYIVKPMWQTIESEIVHSLADSKLVKKTA